MSSRIMSASFRSAVALTAATALVFSGSATTSAQLATQPSLAVASNSGPSSACADQKTPAPTADQLDFLAGHFSAAFDEIDDALQPSVAAGDFGSQPRALPVAGFVIAAAAWCASGALGSLPTSVLADIANGGEGVPYVTNAIIGCFAGNIGTWAWRLLSPQAKKQAIAAVAAFIINYIR